MDNSQTSGVLMDNGCEQQNLHLYHNNRYILYTTTIGTYCITFTTTIGTYCNSCKMVFADRELEN